MHYTPAVVAVHIRSVQGGLQAMKVDPWVEVRYVRDGHKLMALLHKLDTALVEFGKVDSGIEKRASRVGLVPVGKHHIVSYRHPPRLDNWGNVGHQGGSILALSKYSKNIDAAWIFMQWACSKEITTRCTLLGGFAPTRISSFEDPRVKAKAKVGPGTTRHLETVKWTIDNVMASEPDMPLWAGFSNNEIPVELGKLLTNHYEPAAIVVWQLGVAAVLLSPALAGASLHQIARGLPLLLVLGMIHSGVLGIVFFHAVRALPTQELGVLFYLEPARRASATT